jgi:hypothetical protein
LGGFPKLNDNARRRQGLRVGTSKWYALRGQIERIEIGGRDYWTDEALLKSRAANTVKPGESAAVCVSWGRRRWPTPSAPSRRGTSSAQPRRKAEAEVRA